MKYAHPLPLLLPCCHAINPSRGCCCSTKVMSRVVAYLELISAFWIWGLAPGLCLSDTQWGQIDRSINAF